MTIEELHKKYLSLQGVYMTAAEGAAYRAALLAYARTKEKLN
jgi:hypothetical protein